MIYCLNPACPHPENPEDATTCQTCGSQLLLQDRYRVLRALGQGGFGATFLAEDVSLPGSPKCVIKQLRPAATAPHAFEMARNLFWREAKTLGKIGNHPQIPQLLNFFEHDQEFYLVQEFVDGLTLKGEVKKNGPYSEATTRQFLSEVLPIMQYVHQNKVIHRDIKPDNLIRREQDKRLVLIDFGAVKDQVSTPGMSDQTALTAVSVGTPGYAPPEQLSLRPVYASDLYALGATCIYLLTGRSPKDLDYHPNTGEMMWQKYVHISAHFTNVLKKMLEISVRNRYQHAEDVLRALDLEPYLDDLAQSMSTPVSTEPTRPTAGNFGGAGGSSPTSPRSSRLGAAIRRRSAMRNDMTAGGMTAGGSSNSGGGRVSGGKAKQGGLPWLKTKDIQLYRAKGRTDFSAHNLSRSELQGGDFSGCIFRESKIDKSNFQGADLSSADLAKASLVEVNFREANLSRAYMPGANLQRADLRKADLSYATLTNVNLAGANLCGANLTGAKVTDEQLAQAKTNWFTTMPRKRP
ncbi:MAG: serine/threonine-protein kinase [Cyanophyceae cyanobacterium]